MTNLTKMNDTQDFVRAFKVSLSQGPNGGEPDILTTPPLVVTDEVQENFFNEFEYLGTADWTPEFMSETGDLLAKYLVEQHQLGRVYPVGFLKVPGFPVKDVQHDYERIRIAGDDGNVEWNHEIMSLEEGGTYLYSLTAT